MHQVSELKRAVAYKGVFERASAPGIDFESLPPPMRALKQAFNDLQGSRADDNRAADLFSMSLSRAMIELHDRPDVPTPPWFDSLFLMQAEAFRRLIASRDAHAKRVDAEFEARVSREVDSRVYARICELAKEMEAETMKKSEDHYGADEEGKEPKELPLPPVHQRNYRAMTLRAIGRLRRIASQKGRERQESAEREMLANRLAEVETNERDRDAANMTVKERRAYFLSLKAGEDEGGRNSVEVLRDLERDILSVAHDASTKASSAT
eukprot:g3173.t1